MRLNIKTLIGTCATALALQGIAIAGYPSQHDNPPEQCTPSEPVPFGDLFNPVKFVSRAHEMFGGSVYLSGKPDEPQFMLFTIPDGWDWDKVKGFPYAGFTVYVNYGEKVRPYIFAVEPSGVITEQKACPLNQHNGNGNYDLYNCKFEGFDKTHPAAAFLIRLSPSGYFINTRIEAGVFS